MDRQNNSHVATITKHLSGQPVLQCPWTSKAPINAPISNNIKNNANYNNNNNSNNSQSVNGPKFNFQNMYTTPPEKEIGSTINGPVQHSSIQFFHFLRLMQLFPDVHPATLHSVMILCKNDFFGAVDKLLYAKRCKSYYMNQRINNTQQTKNTQQRYQPYNTNNNNNGNVQKNNEMVNQHNIKSANDLVTIKHPNLSGSNEYTSSYYAQENVSNPVDLKISNESKGNDIIPPLRPLNINAVPVTTISTKTPSQPSTNTLISSETTLISL